MEQKQIDSLVASRDANHIVKELIKQDEQTNIRIVCALGLYCYSCRRGLLLPSQGGVSDFLTQVYEVTNTLAFPCCCNVCGFSPNLGVEYLQNRFDLGDLGHTPKKGEPGYEGLKSAEKQLALLE